MTISRFVWLIVLVGFTEAIGAVADEDTSAAASASKLEVASQQGVSSDPPPPSPSGVNVYWKDALWIESADKSLRLKIGGRIQAHGAVFDPRGFIEEDIAEFEDDVEVRRARFHVTGKLGDSFEFKAQIELSSGEVEARDMYFGFRNLPLIGTLRFGHLKEPFGLENMSSSNDITFMERALTSDAFWAERNVGIVVINTAFDRRLGWSAGVFRQTGEFFRGETSDGVHVGGRITATPWYEDDGEKLLHVGIAYSHWDPEGAAVKFHDRPEAHVAPSVVGTGNLAADAVDVLGAEAALVVGPFSLQSEYVHAFVNSEDGVDLQFNSVYVQASYVLTGEHRPYKQDMGSIGRIKPDHPLGEDGGIGAWEVAARYSYVDLNDGDVLGGRVNDWTAGLNWYANSFTRVSWNYVYSDVQNGGFVNIYQMRVQLAF